MGRIICEVHGEQGMKFVSPRLRTAMLARQQMNAADIRKVRFDIFEFECFAYFDDSTIKRFGIPLDHALSKDEFDHFEASNGATLIEPVCTACFMEWRKRLGG